MVGQETLAQGSIITGMIWGSLVAQIIDGKFKDAAYFAFAAAAMSSVGILHAASLQAPTFSPVVIGYVIAGAFFLIYPMTTEIRMLEAGDAIQKTEETSATD